MDTITVRFTTRWPWNPISLAVARLTGSRQWSHCMLIIGTEAFEASMTHGCRVVHIDEAMRGVVAWRDMLVPVPNLAAALAFGYAQNGRPYDWAGALALPLLASEDWADDRSWWCSELVFSMLGAGGTWVLDPTEARRVTPNDLHQVNYPKGAIIRARHISNRPNPA
ncbi:hypothetical protein [Massilia sp. TS11]|uniref:hypothetical protein n=1 Tax=Massilia sp. TS11 TaxID=2908003 RepID=UPI001EDAD0A9|nr:hypothetical protein [Massilia sp. TS11]MCG2585521.1 hypothetical protein [Massilia sp. TS11]